MNPSLQRNWNMSKLDKASENKQHRFETEQAELSLGHDDSHDSGP